MLSTKLFEVRDVGTFIPVIATHINRISSEPTKEECYLMSRTGYGSEPLVLLTKLGGGGMAHYDPYAWDNSTMLVAHKHIAKNFSTLNTGDVIDVEFITGKTTQVKLSERICPI